MFPTVVLNAHANLDKRPPFRAFRFADQMEAGFLGSAIGFECIAGDAGTYNILPSRWPSMISGNDMVQIQIFPLKDSSAVFASVAVALKNVVPGEFHLFLGHSVKHDQKDDPRDADLEGNGGDGFRMWLLRGKVAPLGKTESLKHPVAIAQDDLGVALKQQRQSAARRADIDRLPKAVEHQHMLIEETAHKPITFAQQVT